MRLESFFRSYCRSVLRRISQPWVIALSLTGLLLCLAIGMPVIKRKLTSPRIYRVAEARKHVQGTTNILKDNQELKPTDKRALLPGAKWVPQTFNNCVPATVSMLLQYFGYNIDQNETKKHLRTNPDDKNVFTYEIQDYLETRYGIESKLLYNGDIETLKLLIANGFYVIVENWLHPNEDIGHVTIIRGYDDEQGVFVADDSYMGINIIYNYEDFDKTQWKPFNREYLPLYKTGQEQLLKKIIGENWNEEAMYENALKKALQEIKNDEKDMYAYFNLGTSYFALHEYENAKEAFDKSRNLGWPRRMLWYQIQPVQTLIELGNYTQALELASLGLWANDSFAELHYEKARAYKGLGQIDNSQAELHDALYYSPNYQNANDLLTSL